ncbi:hypothetical protein CC78DRAFT_621411 [Lojkania enalia]|uniref:Uncharacterized protein n=1 Tax=Lojkania enalia TaxID=147567 RepID=A0A9P4MY85_9PLEO|nr:hypothetical protein CC78DRAFT_621411 [Didymosphaeria enalia]
MRQSGWWIGAVIYPVASYKVLFFCACYRTSSLAQLKPTEKHFISGPLATPDGRCFWGLKRFSALFVSDGEGLGPGYGVAWPLAKLSPPPVWSKDTHPTTTAAWVDPCTLKSHARGSNDGYTLSTTKPRRNAHATPRLPENVLQPSRQHFLAQERSATNRCPATATESGNCPNIRSWSRTHLHRHEHRHIPTPTGSLNMFEFRRYFNAQSSVTMTYPSLSVSLIIWPITSSMARTPDVSDHTSSGDDVTASSFGFEVSFRYIVDHTGRQGTHPTSDIETCYSRMISISGT